MTSVSTSKNQRSAVNYLNLVVITTNKTEYVALEYFFQFLREADFFVVGRFPTMQEQEYVVDFESSQKPPPSVAVATLTIQRHRYAVVEKSRVVVIPVAVEQQFTTRHYLYAVVLKFLQKLVEKSVVAAEKLTIQQHISAADGEFLQDLVVDTDVVAGKSTIQVNISAALVDKCSIQSKGRVQQDPFLDKKP